MNFTVYILYSPGYDKFYIGQTNNLNVRIIAHNNSDRNTYTSKYRPWQLFWNLNVANRSIAMKIEKYLKNKNKEFFRRLPIDSDLENYIKKRFHLV